MEWRVGFGNLDGRDMFVVVDWDGWRREVGGRKGRSEGDRGVQDAGGEGVGGCFWGRLFLGEVGGLLVVWMGGWGGVVVGMLDRREG